MCFVLEQVLPTDESVEHKKSHRQSHRKKVLPEIYLTRLLSTKVGDGCLCSGQGVAVCLEREACSREGVQQGWLLQRGSGCWSMVSGAAGHSWLLGLPPAFQLTLGAAALWEAPQELPGLVWGLCLWKGC